MIRSYEDQIKNLNHRIDRYIYGEPIREFDSFEQAIQACETADAYENERLVQYIRAKNDLFIPSITNPSQVSVDSASLAAATIFQRLYFSVFQKKKVKVIDFGGAFGNAFHFLDHIVGEKVQVDWRVVETPTMVKHTQGLESERLSFFDSLEEACKGLSGVDLLFTSGAIQYVENPEEQLLKLMELKAQYMFFNRSAFSLEEKSIVSIQKSRVKDNGPQVPCPGFEDIEETFAEYPVSYMTRDSFCSHIEKKYKLLLAINETSGVHPVNQNKVFGNSELYQIKE